MAQKYLDLTGLTHFWEKVQAHLTANYAAKSHTHNTSDVTGLTALLDGKALKSEALGTAGISGSNVTIKFTANTVVPGSGSTSSYTIPTSGASTLGVITHETVKQLAGEVAGSVYKVKGTKENIEDVLGVPSAEIGDVYNVTNEFQLNLKKYPAGTNVVFVGDGTPEGTGNDPTQEDQWDALGGTVDLTPYAKTSEVASTYATKAQISDMLTKTEAGTTYATKAQISDMLTKTEAGTTYAKISHKHNVTDLNATTSENNKILKVVSGVPTWSTEYAYTLPAAGASLGGVKSGGVATISGGLITAISKASSADTATTATTATKVANALTIKGLTEEGELGAGITFNGSAAQSLEAITFAEIDSVFA